MTDRRAWRRVHLQTLLLVLPVAVVASFLGPCLDGDDGEVESPGTATDAQEGDHESAEAVVRQFFEEMLSRDLSARRLMCPDRRLSVAVMNAYFDEFDTWIPLDQTRLDHVSVSRDGRRATAEVDLRIDGATSEPFIVNLEQALDGSWRLCGQTFPNSSRILEEVTGAFTAGFERADGEAIDLYAVNWRQMGWSDDKNDRSNWSRPGSEGQQIIMRLMVTVYPSEAQQREARHSFLSDRKIAEGAVESLDVPIGCIGVRWAGLIGGMAQPPDYGRFEEYVLCEWDTSSLLIRVVRLGTEDRNVAGAAAFAIQSPPDN